MEYFFYYEHTWPRLQGCIWNKGHVTLEDPNEIHIPTVAEASYNPHMYAVLELCCPQTPLRAA